MQALALGPVRRLLGVNVDGWLTAGAAPEHYGRFVSDADLARLFNWRLTHARLPVDAALLEAPEGWRVLDDAVARCLRQRLDVVIALRHADHAALFATPTSWRPLAAQWRTIAERYRETGAIFDLLDAPSPPPDVSEAVLTELGAARLSAAAARRARPAGAAEARAWNALAVRLTHAVREANESAALVVESAGARPDTFALLRPTRDTHTHYSFHAFVPEPFTRRGEGSYPGEVDGERWDRERLQHAIEPALTFARTYETTLYVGAFGVTDRAPRQSRLTWTRSFLSLCRGSGIGWAYWTLRHPHFGLVVEGAVDYDLLGVLQSE